MTTPAGRRDVVPVDRRTGIGGRQLVVGRVAVRAVGGDSQSAFEQTLGVDAVQVAFHDALRLRRSADCGLLPRAMAIGAQSGDVPGKRGGLRLIPAEDLVRAVAVSAFRCVGTAFSEQHTVRALVVLGDRLGVADGTIHLLDDRFTRTVMTGRGARVALYARRSRVARTARALPGSQTGKPFALLARR